MADSLPPIEKIQELIDFFGKINRRCAIYEELAELKKNRETNAKLGSNEFDNSEGSVILRTDLTENLKALRQIQIDLKLFARERQLLDELAALKANKGK